MKKVEAEYDASERVLRLVEPLENVNDHARVNVFVEEPAPKTEKPWMKFAEILGEDSEDFARAVNELFPPWDSSTE